MRNPSHTQKFATGSERNAGMFREVLERVAYAPNAPTRPPEKSFVLKDEAIRREDAAVSLILGSGNLNVRDDIRVATFRITGVYGGGGIAIGSAVGYCGIRI
jgi:hypothetical protein